MSELVSGLERAEELREMAMALRQQSWCELDGGLYLTLEADQLEREADAIEARTTPPTTEEE